MSVLSVTCCALLSAVCAFTLVSAAGCGTDAKGVDDCRDIEQARCDAAQHCGIVSDVAECQRFYRDQCLHGLQVASPGSVKVKACVATIRAAGVCAATDEGNDVALASCDPAVTSDAPGATTACDVVKEPEKAAECSFLAPAADAGSGGSAGTGGGTGKAGAGGASTDGGTAGDAGGT